YHLALLDRPRLEALIAEGTIHPAITLPEAKELVARFNGKPGIRNERRTFKGTLRHVCDLVRRRSADWTAAERDIARAKFFQVALELKAPSVPLPAVNRLFPDCNSIAAGSPHN